MKKLLKVATATSIIALVLVGCSKKSAKMDADEDNFISELDAEEDIFVPELDAPFNPFADQESITVVEKRSREIPEVAKKAFDSAVELTAKDFEYELTDDGNGVRLTNYIGLETAIKLPAEIEGMPVTEMKWIFNSSGKKLLDTWGTPVTLSNGEQLYAAILETVVIPDSVTRIIGMNPGVKSKLKYVKLSESISELPEDVFIDCNMLEYIYIPDGVVSIGNGAFTRTALKSIDLSLS